jgi:hypothetical protein
MPTIAFAKRADDGELIAKIAVQRLETTPGSVTTASPFASVTTLPL